MEQKNQKHILIIDDEEEITRVMSSFFEKFGFSTESAHDGIKALASVKNRLPDIVITDLLLPGEHGINIVKTIKEKYFIPVIIITGIYEEAELKSLIEDYFVEAFFAKPFDLEKLLEKVKDILAKRPS